MLLLGGLSRPLRSGGPVGQIVRNVDGPQTRFLRLRHGQRLTATRGAAGRDGVEPAEAHIIDAQKPECMSHGYLPKIADPLPGGRAARVLDVVHRGPVRGAL